MICKIMDTMKSEFNLHRFVEAQDSFSCYEKALAEVSQGRKQGHWIWYVFPQIVGLGRSYQANYYGIGSRQEAKAYLEHEVLQSRLYEITTALLQHREKSAQAIFGGLDAMKVCSSMTLFEAIKPNSVFTEVLEFFYGGHRCKKTLEFLKL